MRKVLFLLLVFITFTSACKWQGDPAEPAGPEPLYPDSDEEIEDDFIEEY